MKWLPFFLLLFAPFCSKAQQAAKGENVLSLKSLTNDSSSSYLLEKWRFKEADSPAMALPGYDDSKWETIYSTLRIGNFPKSASDSFNSIGWFRYSFVADSSLVGIPLAITLTQYGASQIYLDGKTVDTFGVIKDKKNTVYFDPQQAPVALVINNAGRHVIAVRFANFNAQKNAKYGRNFGGFKMTIGQAKYQILNSRVQARIFSLITILFFSIFISFAILHLFLYLYYRSFRANLFFSIFCLSVAVIFYTGYSNITSNNPTIQGYNSFYSFLALVTACYAMSAFTNDLFSNGKLRLRITLATCFATVALSFLSFTVSLITCLVLIAWVAVEAVILNILAIIKKVKGAKILGFGILSFCIFVLSSIVITILKGSDNVSTDSLAGIFYLLFIAFSILSLPASMSLYLSWKFATINKELKKQLDQVQVLSEKTLEQERQTKRMLENQNETLEREVAARTAEITAQNKMIELKNKAITDNIDYAQRIQSAILPDIKLIHKTLTQSFILFLPKDIVSGDFYAYAEKNGRVFIVAGDCTGHGVSGAFMSMIGSSLLNQIINEKGVMQPAQILAELNIAVIEALKQGENESNDGMDIAVCSFDLAQNELQYAGAYRPLWLIRNKEIITYNHDKFPIGGLQMARNRAFTNYTIQLVQGDTIYIFTDGYPDQFGGANGKKLMTSKFRETLLSIQQMDMAGQQTYLNQFFYKWKGDAEQVDDVLVIGVRI